jgi:hypothetical protein
VDRDDPESERERLPAAVEREPAVDERRSGVGDVIVVAGGATYYTRAR